MKTTGLYLVNPPTNLHHAYIIIATIINIIILNYYYKTILELNHVKGRSINKRSPEVVVCTGYAVNIIVDNFLRVKQVLVVIVFN